MAYYSEILKGVGKAIGIGEKGAKIGVKWVGETGKIAKGSFSKLEGLSTKTEKVLSRPLAEQRKAEAFAKKYCNVTFTNKAGKEQVQFSYNGGKIFDHKTGQSFLPKQFPSRLAEAKMTKAEEMMKQAQSTAKNATKGTNKGKGFFGRSADWAEKHHKIATPFIWTGIGWGALQIGRQMENGLIGFAGKGLGGKNGVVNSVGEGVLGSQDYADLRDNLDSVTDEVKGAYGGAKSAVLGISNEAVDFYQGGKQLIGGAFQGNGMVSDGNGGYYDPSTQPYPSMAQMTGQQGSDMTGGLMRAMNNSVNTITGGNVGKLDVAGLLLSAYMMFGRFGWLGKAASLMLGGMTLRNINGHHQAVQNQQQRNQQEQQQQTRQQYPLQTAEMPVEEENTVIRMRRL